MNDRGRFSSPSWATLRAYVHPAAMEARRRKARENFGRGTPIPGAAGLDPTLPTGVAPEFEVTPVERDDAASPWGAEAELQIDASYLPSAAAPPVTAAPARPRRRTPTYVVVGVLLGLAVATLAIATPLALGWRPAGKAGAVTSTAGSPAVRPAVSASAAPAVSASAAPAVSASAAPAGSSTAGSLAPVPAPAPNGKPAPERPRPTGTRSQPNGGDPYSDAAVTPRPVVTAVPSTAPVVTATPTAAPSLTNEPAPNQGLPYQKKNP